MGFWKIGLCFTILTFALALSYPLEEEKANEAVDVLSGNIKYFITKEDWSDLVTRYNR